MNSTFLSVCILVEVYWYIRMYIIMVLITVAVQLIHWIRITLLASFTFWWLTASCTNDQCSMNFGRPPTSGPLKLWAIVLHSPSPCVTTHSKSWYSFYHPTEGRRLSRPRWLASYWDGLTACRPGRHRVTLLFWHNMLPLCRATNQLVVCYVCNSCCMRGSAIRLVTGAAVHRQALKPRRVFCLHEVQSIRPERYCSRQTVQHDLLCRTWLMLLGGDRHSVTCVQLNTPLLSWTSVTLTCTSSPLILSMSASIQTAMSTR